MKKTLLLLSVLLLGAVHVHAQSLSASCTPVLNSPIVYSCPFASGFSYISGSYVKLNVNSSAVVNGTTSDTAAQVVGIPLKIVQSRVILQTSGSVTLNFDGATTIGHMIVLSTTTSGYFHDTGGTTCSATTLGVVSQTIGGVGQATAFLGACTPALAAAYANPVTLLVDGATITWAIASTPSATATVTFTVHSGSRTLAITNPLINTPYTIKLVQDATGGEGIILGTGCTWKVSGGGAGAVTLTNGASAIDVLSFWYDGTNCYAVLTANFT